MIYIQRNENNGVSELHIVASPEASDVPIEGLFAAVAETLRQENATIFQERIFCTADAVEQVQQIRASAYGTLDDGVAPVWLTCQPGATGALAGVHVHALVTDQPIKKLDDGRAITMDGKTFIALTGVQAPQAGTPAEQTLAMLTKARDQLGQCDGTFFQVARTWMWLEDILDWYDEFNVARTGFFRELGLMIEGKHTLMPASTGVGVGPAGPGVCAMDLVAVVGDAEDVEYHDVCGNQESAYDYGSAFSRAATATTPSGKTVYVSGTAAIDAAGETIYHGDIHAQTQDSIDNVRAVLNDHGCSDDDLVQAIFYCKTPEAETEVREMIADLDWPCFTAVLPICRDCLLMEIEAMAIKK